MEQWWTTQTHLLYKQWIIVWMVQCSRVVLMHQVCIHQQRRVSLYQYEVSIYYILRQHYNCLMFLIFTTDTNSQYYTLKKQTILSSSATSLWVIPLDKVIMPSVLWQYNSNNVSIIPFLRILLSATFLSTSRLPNLGTFQSKRKSIAVRHTWSSLQSSGVTAHNSLYQVGYLSVLVYFCVTYYIPCLTIIEIVIISWNYQNLAL